MQKTALRYRRSHVMTSCPNNNQFKSKPQDSILKQKTSGRAAAIANAAPWSWINVVCRGVRSVVSVANVPWSGGGRVLMGEVARSIIINASVPSIFQFFSLWFIRAVNREPWLPLASHLNDKPSTVVTAKHLYNYVIHIVNYKIYIILNFFV